MTKLNLSLSVKTSSKEELIEITRQIQNKIDSQNFKNGFCMVYIPHTTAGVTINENADPDVKSDIIATLRKIIPDNLPYRHIEGNSPAHLKTLVTGSSVTVAINNGILALGRWQGIFFAEYDGPRNRNVDLYLW